MQFKIIINFFSVIMFSQSQLIDLDDLCGQLFSIVCNSCHILNEFSHFDSLVWKDKENPVTQIDFLIQSYIVSSIVKRYGPQTLNIVGEEDLTFSEFPEFQDMINTKLQRVGKQQKKYLLHQSTIFNTKFDSRDLCLWIDPIDCTAGFTNNRLYEVTILVGVSYKGKPIFGLIGHPFDLVLNKTIFAPSVYVGSPLLKVKCAYEFFVKQEKWVTYCKDQVKLKNRRTAIGWREGNKQKEIIDNLKLKTVKYSGAGYKCIKVIKQKVGSYLLVDAKTSKWDTCAGEAIITGMGGFVLKPTLESINYIRDQTTTNYQGFLMTLNQQIFQEYVKLLKKY